MIRNKRGDIPITILVIGVLVICALAIISFYISFNSFVSGFDSIGVVERTALIKEKISFYGEELNFDENEIKEIFEIKEDVQGKYIQLTDGPISVRYNLGK